MQNRLLMTGFTVWLAIGGAQNGGSSFKIDRKYIYPKAFQAGRPYSPGVLVGKTLYISGQIDKDPQTGVQPEGIVEQTRMAMKNVGLVLRDAGMDYGNVVSCHVQLANMGQYKEMNEVYGSFFGPDHYPARTTLEFPGLPGGANVEVSCIAYGDKSKISLVTPPPGTVPAAMGPYRSAVWAGDTLYVSGSGGRQPTTNELDQTIEGQTKQTMENIGQILAAAGVEHKDTVFTNVYFLDPNGYKGPTYGKVNSVYKDYFRLGLAPSRASFCVSKLPGTISVEITFIATRDRKNKGRVVPDSAGPSPTSSNGGVLDGDTLYTSGKSGSGLTIEQQMRDSLESIRGILKLAGMDMKHVVDTHVYLKDIAQMDIMNGVFKEYFPNNPPARTTVQVIQDQLGQVQVVAVR
jgi:2-iminobutanoate/2-iminopropanoate deaminase